ncbi:hypothetical protein LO763_17165 [Glycomyces sp. A-F 0318]|uniref:hypothetical protein n=1 Tax=Glycomyces amatae TaxID=2881355 RepID=UPI001E2EC232|nr:hypothetical protein [Glycomyces amatae]MCD0445346.1 hypothetical protein [Glycomyces amatae]
MPRPVPGPGALVSYIRTGARDARIAYRELPDGERLAYRETVRRVYEAAIDRHFGGRPSDEQAHDLAEAVAARHPQYGGGVRRVLRSSAEGVLRSGMSPRQLLTAQHLVVREVAKLHADFRERAEQVVEEASRTLVSAGLRSALEDRAAERGEDSGAPSSASGAGPVFTGTDADSLVSVTIGLDGSLRALELRRGVERLGGRSLGSSAVRAWVDAEKQRWRRAKELGVHDAFPEIGSGRGGGDAFRGEAYCASGLCRATVDRYGRLRDLTFMRTALFGDDGRLGLAAEIREAITGAQRRLADSW